MSRPLDATDWPLLAQLQDDAWLSLRELARRGHLSAGRGVVAHVRLSYGPRCVLRDREVGGWPEVLELHLLASPLPAAPVRPLPEGTR